MAQKPYAKMKKLVAKALAHKETLANDIFACADNSNTPFNDCYHAASEDLRQAYNTAVSELIHAEQLAISSGTAWRSSFGMLTFYQ